MITEKARPGPPGGRRARVVASPKHSRVTPRQRSRGRPREGVHGKAGAAGQRRRQGDRVDWASYPILAFPEVPALEFELIQRLDQPPLGVGEAASTPVPAALGNAVFDATGVRLRTVPFRADRVKAALARS